MATKGEKFAGLTVAMVTPFRNGLLDEPALRKLVDWHVEQGHAIPVPSQGLKKVRYIAPDAKTQAALLVRQARGDRPMSEVARAMQTSWPAAQRLESPRHSPSLKQLERAASALGKRLVLSFE